MNILEKAQELRKKMDAELDRVSPLENIHDQDSLRCFIASHRLLELNRFERKYAFGNEQEEITYFRDLKPEFYARYFYYHRLMKWATAAAFKQPEDLAIYYKDQLREMEIEYGRDAGNYPSLLSDESHFHQYGFFTNPLQFDPCSPGITTYEVGKGKRMALYRLRQFISGQLDKSPVRSDFGLKWTGTRTELIELLYALFINGSFGKNTFKKIVEEFADLFQLDLKNSAQYLIKIKMRKETSQTFFLNILSSRLQERFDRES